MPVGTLKPMSERCGEGHAWWWAPEKCPVCHPGPDVPKWSAGGFREAMDRIKGVAGKGSSASGRAIRQAASLVGLEMASIDSPETARSPLS